MSIPSDKLLFCPPARFKSATDITHIALQLAALSGRLALEDRTSVKHSNGRAENVAEHSFMLAMIGPVLAEQFYPDLDANLVGRYAVLHDAVEAYVGDTPTHNIDAAGLKSKAAREKIGLDQFVKDFAHLPGLVQTLTQYEAQTIPEARFIRVLDKLMPLLVHFVEGGTTLRSHIDIPALLENSATRAAQLRVEYPEYHLLIDSREELAHLATVHLYQ